MGYDYARTIYIILMMMFELLNILFYRDFDLSGFEMNYTHMEAPGSFRASVSQLGDVGFEAFRISQKVLSSISTQLPQNSGQVFQTFWPAPRLHRSIAVRTNQPK